MMHVYHHHRDLARREPGHKMPLRPHGRPGGVVAEYISNSEAVDDFNAEIRKAREAGTAPAGVRSPALANLRRMLDKPDGVIRFMQHPTAPRGRVHERDFMRWAEQQLSPSAISEEAMFDYLDDLEAKRSARREAIRKEKQARGETPGGP